MRDVSWWGLALIMAGLALGAVRPASAELDTAHFFPARSGGAQVTRTQYGVLLRWPLGGGKTGELALNLQPNEPLITHLGFAGKGLEESRSVLRDVDPAFWITVGTRGKAESVPGGDPFTVFFDSPAQRPSESYLARWSDPTVRRLAHAISVAGSGKEAGRTVLVVDGLQAGPFSGSLHLTTFNGSPLIQVEAVMTTNREQTAYFYDTGLLLRQPSPSALIEWMDTEGKIQPRRIHPDAEDEPQMARHRTIILEDRTGSIACFPPPHQFFFPRDYTDNLKYVWLGQNHRHSVGEYGFGIRQTATGGGNYSPWYSAPPGAQQRLGVFYLLSPGLGQDALRETLRYTHEDRFRPLPGYRTYTGHYHLAMSVAAMEREKRGAAPIVPEFVDVFRNMGVDIVHLAEFHGDGHQKDPGPLRLPELAAMFRECQALSDDRFLLVPGEEVDEFLGLPAPGRPSGHWMSLFPKPVYWTMRRPAGTPFVTEDPRYGTVYHVGGRDDMVELLQREHGLVWTAHPRIKSSIVAPDAFKDQAFFHGPFWLGGAWKAMPADLSRERLGERVLNLLDDMANWGERKYVPGEVDVFKIDHTHELYGHMNVNYVRLDRVPRYADGWQPLSAALSHGQFFTTTGEVLIPEWTVGGKRSGETLRLGQQPSAEVKVTLNWTFPLKFAEVISGDGTRVYRQRIDLADTGSFGARTLTLHPELRGRKWVRLEAWDVAANGAYTQPVWLEP